METTRYSHKLLRKRSGHASVSFSELLFDLIYVFAVTQLSHYLLHHLYFEGLLQTLILWFGVWLVWQYTAWFTNWFDPDKRPIRVILFATMLISLFMTASIPRAFEDRALVFAICCASMQIGRSAITLFLLGNKHLLTPNYRRILVWACISGFFWILGALYEEQHTRMLLWLTAVLCDYISPMFGFYTPGLGRSDSSKEWTIDGHHLTERCQLFVIIAFGETLLMTGASFSEIDNWNMEIVISTLTSFIGSLAMWWIYFDISSEAAFRKISDTTNPGLLGLKYNVVHIVLVGALIVCAVGDELVVSEPSSTVTYTSLFVLIGGPIIYILANTIFKWITCHTIPVSHIVAVASLLLLIPISYFVSILILNICVVSVLIFIAIFEMVSNDKKSDLELEE
jgi:low temperature requirement protein LtrA